jgi:CRISPR-associated protein Cas2
VLYIVCYDIADEGRRGRAAKVLLDFGRRLEESVFAMNLDEELYGRMKERLGRVVEEMEDTVHVFPLCGACAGKMEVMGRGERPQERLFYVI